MITERDREYLEDMLAYAEAAIRILGAVDAAGLGASEEKRLAVSKALQNIGEAATKLSPGLRSSLPAVPWQKVIGMRHHLVHAYDDIRVDVLVTTVQDDLPPLIAALGQALVARQP